MHAYVDVVLYDHTIVPAQIIGLDDDSDLAVIKTDVPADQLSPLPLGDSDAAIPGQEVIAIGNPFGRQSSMTSGIISAIGRTIPSLTPFSIPQAIQTDAAINPGNSGGPLLNLDREVIGVNAQIDSAVRANAGVGFAIPPNIVARVAPVLIAEGDFAWPWLGVQGTDLTARIAKANELNVTRGAYLTGIVPDSPAAEAGLQGLSGEAMVDRMTGILLILFAPGLFAHGIHELQKAALLPTLVEHVWDTNRILDENGTVGTFLKALFGYNGNPSLLEVGGYVVFLATVGLATRRGWRPPAKPAPSHI